MVEKAAYDYAAYFRKLEVSKQLDPVCATIEQMLARLDEFEGLLSNVKADSNTILKQNIPQILESQKEFDELFNRIDNLEKFINNVKTNLDEMEQTVEIAETELGITHYSLKNLFKPFLGMTKNSALPQTNLQEDGQFKRQHVFSTSYHFGDNKDENL